MNSKPQIPGYWEKPLAEAAAKIRALRATCGDAGFFFVTDLHVPSNECRSGALLARLVAETGFKTVLCGGDIPEAFGNRAMLDDSAAKYRSLWIDEVERAGGDFWPVHGNHDLTFRDAPGVDGGFTLPRERTRLLEMETAATRRGAVFMDGDPGSCAYWFDAPEMRIRFVVPDTSDSMAGDRTWWAVQDSIGHGQLRWLAKEALGTIPRGWGAVVVQHCAVADSLEEKERALFAPWRAVIDAYRARSRVDAGGETVDFADAAGEILFVLAGHHHAERQAPWAGLWHVCEPCDAAYFDYINRSGPFIPPMPEKKAGTPFEQTFDAVQVDLSRALVHFTRIGGGGDRTLHMRPVRVRAGESARLEPVVLAGGGEAAPSWGCYDAARLVSTPNPDRKYDYFIHHFGDVAEIGGDGVLRGKAPGEAVAVALAPDGRRELFAVEVAAP